MEKNLNTRANVNIKKKFGQKVREKRQFVNLSQEELAARAGLHRTYIGSIERGERNIALVNIGKIASALGCSVSELFNE